MDVYAKDRDTGELWVITLEECKAAPWRWIFVQVSPGQDIKEDIVPVVEVSKVETDIMMDATEKKPTNKRGK